jgi:hypothetical protein
MSKEIYCYRILKTYSLIIDYEGDAQRENVPKPIEGETFNQWKKRVLGSNVSNVTVFAPKQPAPQTRISTLQNEAGADHLEKVFKTLGKEQKANLSAAVKDAISNTEEQLSTIALSTLKDILADTDHTLEPSVKEFFARLNDSCPDRIDVKDLLSQLVNTYNNAVRLARLRESGNI